jgi:lysophospholipase L1-like esterase
MAGHTSLRPVLLGRYSVLYASLFAATVAVAVFLALAQLPKPYNRLFSLRRQLLLSLVTTMVFGLALFEFSLRAFDLFGVSFYQEISRCMLDFDPDPVLAFRHKFNFHTRYQGVDVITNEIGLRERPIQPKGTLRRIVVLGDSVTFGWGVRAEEAFPRRLESHLRGGYGVGAETINTGVCGYNTVQERAFLELRGDQLAPDLVVLMYVDNDVDPVEPIRAGRTDALWHDAPGSIAQRLLRATWTYRISYHLLPFALSAAPTAPNRASAGWQASMGALAGIARYCHARNIPFATFVYRMNTEAKTDAIYEDIRGVAERERFSVFDTASWFQGVKPRDYVNSAVDAHPNAKGHDLIARQMAKVIATMIWPQPNPATTTAGVRGSLRGGE